MASGVYKRTQKHKEIAQKAIEIAHQLPRTKSQRDASRRNMKKARQIAWKLPRTKLQEENARKVGSLPKTEKQIQSSRAKRGSDIVEHHNDLCHGKLQPDDITLMTSSEHSRLHAKLQNGYIGKNYGRLQT